MDHLAHVYHARFIGGQFKFMSVATVLSMVSLPVM